MHFATARRRSTWWAWHGVALHAHDNSTRLGHVICVAEAKRQAATELELSNRKQKNQKRMLVMNMSWSMCVCVYVCENYSWPCARNMCISWLEVDNSSRFVLLLLHFTVGVFSVFSVFLSCCLQMGESLNAIFGGFHPRSSNVACAKRWKRRWHSARWPFIKCCNWNAQRILTWKTTHTIIYSKECKVRLRLTKR